MDGRQFLLFLLTAMVCEISGSRPGPAALSGSVIGSFRHSRSLVEAFSNGGVDPTSIVALEPGAPFHFGSDLDPGNNGNETTGDRDRSGANGQHPQQSPNGGKFSSVRGAEGGGSGIKIVPRIGTSDPCDPSTAKLFGQRSPGKRHVQPCQGGKAENG